MRICYVEDDINYRKALELGFKNYPQYEAIGFKNAIEALKALQDSQPFDVIITDINMPKMDGLEFLRELQNQMRYEYKTIVITGNASVQNAIGAIRLGVKDFLVKGFDFEELVSTLERIQKEQNIRAKIQSAQRADSAKKQANQPNDFNSANVATQLDSAKSNDKSAPTSKALQEVLKIAKKVAPTDASVFLMGQSGVGKDVFANFIHQHSPRAQKPFIALNMAAIPEHLLESELFGYEKGAFTDATAPKPGILEDANGGSVFLDEIGEMPASLQAKLLRVIQEKSLTRLGSSKKIPINVRFISATNANIAQKIANGTFREDLFFRLQTIPIFIPPLNERKDEILGIARNKLSQTTANYGFAPKMLSKEAEAKLLEYSWPGNIRELLSVIERAVILSEGEVIDVADLALQSKERVFNATLSTNANSLASLEKELLSRTLQEVGNNAQKASDLLGMDLKVLRQKLTQYGLL
ncbi:sigma-54-dependent Fis family transcriptional regulator [Helicobacter sp. MIT 00-7814]|uniref:sigma-54-dependent transcriptional regulator n=1 Tax=unclassified Helicobacter TaxID=2593540 RepID=UPI000E1FA062|nr:MULTISPECIES: sigma-54 dependent transcriptional regulator [unclassified Helicobacter]RDU54583.1 sigma-54-dependent Fis family transcriptional regulator [Helicobacter sp. MIT 00-7814]RDU54642.1 sigma-54-dependent Fis family transcriptional regulator [Helicobacter sp. MIT 99-10781]